MTMEDIFNNFVVFLRTLLLVHSLVGASNVDKAAGNVAVIFASSSK